MLPAFKQAVAACFQEPCKASSPFKLISHGAASVNGSWNVWRSMETLLFNPDVRFNSNGSISGTVVAQTGARFTSISTLDVTVLDKGQPVQGALISVDGAVAVTDQTGQVTTSTTSQTVTDSGTTWAGVKTVTMQRNNFTGLVAWDTNQSLAHTFMASTVPTGDVGGWAILERQWSPYYTRCFAGAAGWLNTYHTRRRVVAYQ